MPGIKDIAQICGVSANTVSKILNQGNPNFSRPETRARVFEVARQLGYKPNRAAQSMKAQRTRVIGFVTANLSAQTGNLHNAVVYPFLIGLSHALTERGYHVCLIELKEVELSAQTPGALQERFFDGLVIHYGLSPRAAHLLPEFDIPAIWWDSGRFEPEKCLFRNEREIGAQITQKLVDLGHQRIACFFTPGLWRDQQEGRWVHYSFVHRWESYCQVLRENGLEPIPIAAKDADEVAAQIKKLGVTAVLNLSGSFQVLERAACRLKNRIPEDLSLATFDREARLGREAITIGGMIYDRYEAGQTAAQMLFHLLDGDADSVPSVELGGKFDPADTIAPAP